MKFKHKGKKHLLIFNPSQESCNKSSVSKSHPASHKKICPKAFISKKPQCYIWV